MFIRPVRSDDHGAILKLAQTAGIGMTSLPADEDVLQAKIDKVVASFAGDESVRGQEILLFVMEDPASGEIVGTTGIKAHVGLSEPFYSYRLSTITRQSHTLNVMSHRRLLQVTNDLTGYSEIGSLFLLASCRRDRLGVLLSLSRFLFISAFADYFSDQIIAEMRGVHDRDGNAPFYDSLAKHFFGMSFAEADYFSATRGNDFINELMPQYPIYVDLLPKTAQDTIGVEHPNSSPARAMLEREGFRFQGFVDVFDGGPTLQVDKSNIKTANLCRTGKVTAIEDWVEADKTLLANDRFADWRCCRGRVAVQDGEESIILQRNSADWLQVEVGDNIRWVEASI